MYLIPSLIIAAAPLFAPVVMTTNSKSEQTNYYQQPPMYILSRPKQNTPPLADSPAMSEARISDHSIHNCVIGEQQVTNIPCSTGKQGLDNENYLGSENLKPANYYQQPPMCKTLLSWSNITVKGGKDLPFRVNRSSGFIKSGEVVAILGASGSGKTTLLKALVGKIRPSAGSINYRSHEMNEPLLPYIGFVDQHRPLIRHLTVFQTLWFEAKLRIQNFSEKEKRDRVMEVLRLVGLDHVKDTRIGDSTKPGISGGEEKRLTIGLEILTSPSLLIVDEPTSGLDSNNALRIMTLLKSLATNHNTAIMVTLHQARYRIFEETVDRLILTSKGLTLMSGSVQQIKNYLVEIEGPIFREHENPCDTILDVLTDPISGERIVEYVEQHSDRFKDAPQKDLSAPAGFISSMPLILEMRKNPWFIQFRALFERDRLCAQHRLWKILLTDILVSIIIAVIFRQDSTNDFGQYLGFIGGLTLLTWRGALTSTQSLCSEYDIRKRDIEAGLYSPSAYLLSKFIFGTLFGLFFTLVPMNIAFFLGKFHGPGGFDLFIWLPFLLYNFLAYLTAGSIGQLIGVGSAGSHKLANAFNFLALILFFCLHGGNVKLYDDLSPSLKPLTYLFYMKYYHHAQLRLLVEYLPPVSCKGQDFCNAGLTSASNLLSIDPNVKSYYLCAGTLVAMTFFFHILGFLTMRRQRIDRADPLFTVIEKVFQVVIFKHSAWGSSAPSMPSSPSLALSPGTHTTRAAVSNPQGSSELGGEASVKCLIARWERTGVPQPTMDGTGSDSGQSGRNAKKVF